MRRKTKSFMVRTVGVGSDHPVTLQSMTNTDTNDTEKTLQQVEALAAQGAALVRIAVPTRQSVPAALAIVKESSVPIIGDVHFDHRIALLLLAGGIDGLRINPGNIGGIEPMRKVIAAAKETNTAIRIGVNSGSIEKEFLEKYGHPCPEAMVESLEKYVAICSDMDFHKLVLSVKASDVPTMIAANRMVSERLPYPIHLGVTEAGSIRSGLIKSSIGIGALLADGIGDTLRVSLTGDPLQELPVGKEILRALGLRREGVEIIACPTCGRTQIDLQTMVEAVEKLCSPITMPLKIAVMGCVVNGPGEAKEADLGLAGGKGSGIIFRKGEIIARAEEKDLLPIFETELKKMLEEDKQ